MGSQYAARLGVLLALDMAEFQSGIDNAITSTRKLTAAIKKDANNASKDIQAMRYAVEDYGKEVSNVTKMQRMLFDENGKYYQKAKSDQGFAAVMLREAAALDKRYESQNKLIGTSDKMNRYLKSALAYQTTDIVTSLAGGQNPMMVLLQQGGQLRDQFGGFKPLFKGIAEVVTLSRLAMVGLGATIGIAAYAAYKGSVEFAKLRDDLILTNNYAGLTQGTFAKLSTSLSSNLNISIGDAKDIFGQLAASGKFTATSMDSVAYAMGMVAKLSGESGDAVAQRLIPSFDGSASSAKNLNNQYHFLTLEQYKYIEQLNRQGKLQEAAEFTAGALTSSLQKQTRELGFLEQAWSATTKAASGFWNTMLEIGKPGTLEDAVSNSRKAMLSASEALTGNLSPLAKKNAQKLFDYSVEAYKAASAKLAAEKDKTLKDSAQKAKEQSDIDKYSGSGGLEKSLSIQADIRKQAIDKAYQDSLFNATEMERIDIESAKRIAEKTLEIEKQNSDEKFAQSALRYKQLTNFVLMEESRAAQEKQKISTETYLSYEKKQIAEKDSLDMEKQKMGVYQSNFFITQQEAKLAERKLETQQKIAEIIRDMNNGKIGQDAAAKLIEQQEAIGKTKDEIISLGEKLQYVKDINQAVFQSMTMAIQAFLITGKFSFKDFARSVVASLIQIQAQMMALSMMRGFGSMWGGIGALNLGTAATYGTNPGSQQTAMLAAQNSGLASGGPIDGPRLVGENGPEIFVPSGAGTIIPNQRMGDYGGGGATNVTNNYIQAIDTKSFEDRLYGSSKAIWAANQYAGKNISTSRSRT